MWNHASTCSTTTVSRINATIQYQLNLHSTAGEERVRRNVGEVTSNSRDPGKIVEGSQTSLSKLINERYGLETFKISFLQKYNIYSL